MEVIWSPESLQDVEEIGDYIALDSVHRAINFIDELIESVERLADFPESGKIVEENPIFRELVYHGYRIVYQARSQKIFIVTVLGRGQLLRK